MRKALWFAVLMFSLIAPAVGAAIDPAVTETLPLTRTFEDWQQKQKAKKAKPEAPVTTPTAVAHSVSLTWTQSPDPTCTPTACPVTGNQVLRGTVPGSETLLATLTTPQTAYTDTAVTPGTTYYYQVTAVNVNGPSAPSAEVLAVVPNNLTPNAPTGLTAVPQ